MPKWAKSVVGREAKSFKSDPYRKETLGDFSDPKVLTQSSLYPAKSNTLIDCPLPLNNKLDQLTPSRSRF